MTTISKKSILNNAESIVLLCGKNNSFNNYGLSKAEIDFIKNEISKKEKKFIYINQLNRLVLIQVIEVKKEKHLTLEFLRKEASIAHTHIIDFKVDNISIIDADNKPAETLAFAEGLA